MLVQLRDGFPFRCTGATGSAKGSLPRGQVIAFYGQTENIRVGYLNHDDAISLITQPHPDFALENSPELREELYRLGLFVEYFTTDTLYKIEVNVKEKRSPRGV